MNKKGELIHDKIKKDTILLQDKEGLGQFSSELPIIEQIQELFDKSLGKTRFMHVIRDKVHQFIYYSDTMTFFNTEPVFRFCYSHET